MGDAFHIDDAYWMYIMFLILLMLTGCFEPEFTGPDGMVGRVIDAEENQYEACE